MGKLVISEFVSLDGVIEDPGGAEKTKNGGWTIPYTNEEFMKFKFDELFATKALLLGRITYEGFAAAWPSMKDEQGFADRMNNIAKYVVTTTLSDAKWTNSKLIKQNVADEVAKLKGQTEELLVFGSGKLIKTLMQHDLVDEYRLLVYPVVLGSGKRLFTHDEMKKLKLVEARPFKTGVVLLRYVPVTKNK